MDSENDEGDGDMCYGSQNLFSSQSSSQSLSQDLETSSQNAENKDHNNAVKAVLQMLQLYYDKLQAAQTKASKQMDWVVVNSTPNFPDNATSLVDDNRYCGVLATVLQPTDTTKNESEDSVTTRGKKDRKKTLVLKANVSKMFQFKVTESHNLLLQPETDNKANELKPKDSPRLNLIEKGTTWLKSKIGLKRKKAITSDSEDDFKEEGERKKINVENIDKNSFKGLEAASERCGGSLSQVNKTEHVSDGVDSRIKVKGDRSNQYSTVDLDDDEDDDNDRMSNTTEPLKSAKPGIIDVDSDAEDVVVRPINKATNVQKRPVDRSKTKVSCPLCQREFSPTIINDHAFTCNGETEPREKRSHNLKRKEEERLPSATDGNFGNCELSDLNEGKAFGIACSKVVLNQEETGNTENKKLSSVFKGNASCTKSTIAPSRSEKVDEPPISTPPLHQVDDKKAFQSTKEQLIEVKRNEKNEHEKENKIRTVKSIYSRKTKKDLQGSKVTVTDVNDFMSEDSEDRQDLDTTGDILHQYLLTSPLPLKRRQVTGVSRVFEDSQLYEVERDNSTRKKSGREMEKCFICGKSFPSGEEYRKHVEEEIDKMDGRKVSLGTEQRDSETKPLKEKASLVSKLGNRESWTAGNLVKRHEDADSNLSEDDENENPDSDTIKVGEVSDSPIKGFKFIDENSDFDFQGQFQSKGKAAGGRNKASKSKFKGRRRRRNVK